MKVLILTGSPAAKSNSFEMAQEFAGAAVKAGHEVSVVDVAKKKISGCKACKYCHTTGNGVCIQKDDMQEVIALAAEAEALIIASPIYYFTMSSQLQATIQRFYCLGKLPKIQKIGLLLSSASPDVFDGPIAQIKKNSEYFGAEYMGAVTSVGTENGTKEKLQEVRLFASKL